MKGYRYLVFYFDSDMDAPGVLSIVGNNKEEADSMMNCIFSSCADPEPYLVKTTKAIEFGGITV